MTEDEPKLSRELLALEMELNTNSRMLLELIQKNEKHQKELSDLLYQKDNFRGNITNKEKELENLHEKINKLQSKMKILKIFQEYFVVNSQMYECFSNKEYENILTNIERLGVISKALHMDKEYNTVYLETLEKAKFMYGNNAILKENSVAFSDPQSLKSYFSLLHFFNQDNGFVDYTMNYYIYSFMPQIIVRNLQPVKSALAPIPTIKLQQRNEQHTPSSAINAFVFSTQFVFKNLENAGFEICQKIRDQIMNTAVSSALSTSGGLQVETNQAVEELSKICKSEIPDLGIAANASKLPRALAISRNIIQDGKSFSEALRAAMDIFQGAPTDGLLKRVTAIYISKHRQNKERMIQAEAALSTIGGMEALECLMAIRKSLDK